MWSTKRLPDLARCGGKEVPRSAQILGVRSHGVLVNINAKHTSAVCTREVPVCGVLPVWGARGLRLSDDYANLFDID